MENRNAETDMISEERIAQAIELRDGIRNTDTTNLKRRFEATIRKKEHRLRRLTLIRRCSAVAVVLLAAGAVFWLAQPERTEAVIARVSESVMLTLPDGSQISLDEAPAYALVGRFDDVVIQREAESLVYIQQDGAAEKADALFSTLDVPRGNQFDIILSDGTRVWLNSDSRLRFPSVFPGGERRVHLEGEAYFDVSHDSRKPFVVETAAQTLTVLGTEFNIYAYPDDDAVYTTLVDGSVRVRSLSGRAERLLVPNEQARLDAEADAFTVEKVNAKGLTAWKDRVFVFEGDTMEQIMQKLARWYDMEYVFEDPEARNFVARGSFNIPEDVNSILRLIEMSGDIKFDIQGNRIKVSMTK